ncbi:hypothetical protein G6O69_29385 [Pseudenhygromyxa sp. WMMC2535]|uniref:hypothetical protein n=1 Tax=Pseudenhygromyxa sp. WMMC2535 TaxID=2712867 RepID=UPI001555C456|nr:hypothetical protein [Pseudenhygromyxa sp. WMMC2535]NVB41976.1 hypothetical protein [Pseudenhygromyxa sp. WMMC2535]
MSPTKPTPAMRRRAAQRKSAAAQLRRDLLHHLWTAFPLHCVTLGEAQAKACVEHIIERGQAHGSTSLAGLRSYANLMLFMGSRFDEDPQLPWVAAQLGHSKSIAELSSRAAVELGAIAGAEGQHYRRALLWARSKRFDALYVNYAQRGEPGLQAMLRATWEQKVDALGEAGVAELLADARARSIAHFEDGAQAPLTNEWIMVYSSLMLLLGSAFALDPFHPWVGPALARAAEHPNDAAGLLHTAAVRELERFLILDRIDRDV